MLYVLIQGGDVMWQSVHVCRRRCYIAISSSRSWSIGLNVNMPVPQVWYCVAISPYKLGSVHSVTMYSKLKECNARLLRKVIQIILKKDNVRNLKYGFFFKESVIVEWC